MTYSVALSGFVRNGTKAGKDAVVVALVNASLMYNSESEKLSSLSITGSDILELLDARIFGSVANNDVLDSTIFIIELDGHAADDWHCPARRRKDGDHNEAVLASFGLGKAKTLADGHCSGVLFLRLIQIILSGRGCR